MNIAKSTSRTTFSPTAFALEALFALGALFALRAILLTSLLASLSACEGTNTTSTPDAGSADVGICESNDDCLGDELCIAGVCSEGECQNKLECGNALICLERVCVIPPPTCGGPDDCPGEELCDGFSRTCFDPNSSGCQTDNQCQLEPGCSSGCYCDNGTCRLGEDPGPGVTPPISTGAPLEFGGYRIENRKAGSVTATVLIPDGVVLEPGDVLVIARNVGIDAFERVWGEIPLGTWYFNGGDDPDNQNGFPIVNGQDTWAIVSPSGSDIDLSIEGSSGNNYTRTQASNGANASAWRISDNLSNATPGRVSTLPASGIGLVISEWSDADEYENEFIELYYAP